MRELSNVAEAFMQGDSNQGNRPILRENTVFAGIRSAETTRDFHFQLSAREVVVASGRTRW